MSSLEPDHFLLFRFVRDFHRYSIRIRENRLQLTSRT